jgi:hypothetical protein
MKNLYMGSSSGVQSHNLMGAMVTFFRDDDALGLVMKDAGIDG